MVESRSDKDRVKCPNCGAFLMEVKPRLNYGQSVVTKCRKCNTEVEVVKK